MYGARNEFKARFAVPASTQNFVMKVSKISRILLFSLFLTTGIFLTIFCDNFNFLFDFTTTGQDDRRIREQAFVNNDQELVAYSLPKRIELDGENYVCPTYFNLSSTKTREKFESDVWTKIEDSNVYVYSVYEDRRLEPYRYLRIIAAIKGRSNKHVYCQFVTQDESYHIIKATKTKIWSENWNQKDPHTYFDPYLLSCRMPKNLKKCIGLSTKPCQISAHHNLKLKGTEFKNSNFVNNFTVCVKALNFPKGEDLPRKLLQWIAINQVFGADKFDFYVENLHPNAIKLLQILEETLPNSVNIQKHFPIALDSKKIDSQVIANRTKSLVLSHSKSMKNHRRLPLITGYKKIDAKPMTNRAEKIWQKRRYELVTYNDCLYRNIHLSRFVIPVDIDEIIVPKHAIYGTWVRILNKIPPKSLENRMKSNKDVASFMVQNAYFMSHSGTSLSPNKITETNSESDIFFLKNLMRSELSRPGESGKSFISTANTLTVFNHYALETLRPGIQKIQHLSPDLVQMNHYKSDCDVEILPQCAKYLSSPIRVIDDVIAKYKIKFYEKYVRLKKNITAFDQDFFLE